MTVTLVAGLGPKFVTVTVNVTLLPTSGAALLATLVICKLAFTPGIVSIEDVLLVKTGSGWAP